MIQRYFWSLAALLCLALTSGPATATYSGLTNAEGESPFSPEFLRDYESATSTVNERKSAEPFLKLLHKYKLPHEVAELELTLGSCTVNAPVWSTRYEPCCISRMHYSSSSPRRHTWRSTCADHEPQGVGHNYFASVLTICRSRTCPETS